MDLKFCFLLILVTLSNAYAGEVKDPCELDKTLLGAILKSVAIYGNNPSTAVADLISSNGSLFEGKKECDPEVTKKMYADARLGAALRTLECKEVKYKLVKFQKTENKHCFQIQKTNIYNTLNPSGTLEAKPITVLDACLEKTGPDQWTTIRATSENPIYINSNINLPDPTLTSDVQIFDFPKEKKTCVPLQTSQVVRGSYLGEVRCNFSLEKCKQGWADSIETITAESKLIKYNETKKYTTCDANIFMNFNPRRNPNASYDKVMTDSMASLHDIRTQINICNEIYGDLRKLDWFKQLYMENHSAVPPQGSTVR